MNKNKLKNQLENENLTLNQLKQFSAYGQSAPKKIGRNQEFINSS